MSKHSDPRSSTSPELDPDHVAFAGDAELRVGKWEGNLLFINTLDQMRQKDGKWVLAAVIDKTNRLEAGHANVGDPARLHEAITCLAKRIQTTSRDTVDRWAKHTVAANLTWFLETDDTIVIRHLGTPVLEVGPEATSVLHDPSMGAAAVFTAAIARAHLNPSAEPTTGRTDRWLDWYTSGTHPMRHERRAATRAAFDCIPGLYRAAMIVIPVMAVIAGTVMLYASVSSRFPGALLYGLAAWWVTFAWHTIRQVANNDAQHAGMDFEISTGRSLSKQLPLGWTLQANVITPYGPPDLDYVVTGPNHLIVVDAKWSAYPDRDYTSYRTCAMRRRARLQRIIDNKSTHRAAIGLVIRSSDKSHPPATEDGTHLWTEETLLTYITNLQFAWDREHEIDRSIQPRLAEPQLTGPRADALTRT